MIKILFIAANPDGTSRLRLDREERRIMDRLRAAGQSNNFMVENEPAALFTDLQSYLLRHRPDIVHFSGHGEVEGICLEAPDSSVKLVSGKALGELFGYFQETIRCIVLNSCFSALQASAIIEKIPCVVGMSKAITDAAAIAFAGSFYEALAFGESMAGAFRLACTQIDIAGHEGADTPQLLVRADIDAKDFFMRQAQEVESGPLTLLLAEDDNLFATRVNTEVKNRFGDRIEVMKIGSIRGAIDLIKSRRKPFSLAVVDINLGPFGSRAGLEIVRVLHERSKTTKVVVCTAIAEDMEPDELVELGGIIERESFFRKGEEGERKLFDYVESCLAEMG